jgi:hypothetical protein
LLEAELTSGREIIVIKTQTKGVTWSNRLTAWIKAWADGGVVKEPEGKGGGPVDAARAMRADLVQINVPDPAGTVREGRVLLEHIMDRFEKVAREAVQWYRDERVRKRRVDLLKPYRFAFAIDPEGHKQIFFYKVSE